MEVDRLIKARRDAEAAVKDMPEGGLKNTAFATILTHQLQEEISTAVHASSRTPKAKPTPSSRKASGQRREGTTARLLGLIDEEFFAQPRSLSEIRTALAERGWHYQVESLGTPVTRLVQSRHKHLRRTQVAEGGKRVWKYSNY